MKCHAGVEFESGKPCPKCHAKLGEVCWPGINADLLELARLREFVGWVDSWVSNPVGAYSVSALDGLFGMTRDKIASLALSSNKSEC